MPAELTPLSFFTPCGKWSLQYPVCPPWRQKSFPPPSFLVRVSTQEGDLGTGIAKWGQIALQGGQSGYQEGSLGTSTQAALLYYSYASAVEAIKRLQPYICTRHGSWGEHA